MSFSTNAIDGLRTYFEDDGGGGIPVVVDTADVDPVLPAVLRTLRRAS